MGGTVGGVVFVRKSPGRSGAVKVQIAERRAGRDVVLEHVGTAHDDAELAALMGVARGKLYPGQGELTLDGVSPRRVDGQPGSATIRAKSNAVLWQVLQGVYARLGFDTIDDDAFAKLVLARLIEPTSKADSVRVLDELGIDIWAPSHPRHPAPSGMDGVEEDRPEAHASARPALPGPAPQTLQLLQRRGR